MAEVLAVGPGGLVDGKEVTMSVKVGDKVITSKYSGTTVKIDGEELTIVRQGRYSGDCRVSTRYSNISIIWRFSLWLK